ncbi:hypothetical protein EGJ55_12110 [Pseudomonas moraviensis]|nr:hypothetical protein EGJ55_12110 [Pseudomonas moraviensis]
MLSQRDICCDRSHALRGNASRDAPRPVTRSVTGCIPTRSVGTISTGSNFLVQLTAFLFEPLGLLS